MDQLWVFAKNKDLTGGLKYSHPTWYLSKNRENQDQRERKSSDEESQRCRGEMNTQENLTGGIF